MKRDIRQGTVKFYFKKPEEVSPNILDQIQNLIKKGGGVGSAYIEENLQNAFLVSYAMDQNRVVGTVTLKHPKDFYRKKIEAATGLDLSGYLERGYTSVHPEFRDQDIADALIKGLIEKSKGQKIYVTIRMDNISPLMLTYKNNMILSAQFINERTGHQIGLFMNQ
jgi:GNAT superfamily N-acetyltransferase